MATHVVEVAGFELSEGGSVLGDDRQVNLLDERPILVPEIGVALQGKACGRRVVREVPGTCPDHVAAEVERAVGFFWDDVDTAAIAAGKESNAVNQRLRKPGNNSPAIGRGHGLQGTRRNDAVADGVLGAESLPAEEHVVHVHYATIDGGLVVELHPLPQLEGDLQAIR